MADYALYANSCGIKQNDMVRIIQRNYPHFGKPHIASPATRREMRSS